MITSKQNFGWLVIKSRLNLFDHYGNGSEQSPQIRQHVLRDFIGRENV